MKGYEIKFKFENELIDKTRFGRYISGDWKFIGYAI